MRVQFCNSVLCVEMAPPRGGVAELQLRLVECFRSCPNAPDVFRHWPPVGPVFPPCPRLGAGIRFRPWPSSSPTQRNPGFIYLHLTRLLGVACGGQNASDQQKWSEALLFVCVERRLLLRINGPTGSRTHQNIIFISVSVCVCWSPPVNHLMWSVSHLGLIWRRQHHQVSICYVLINKVIFISGLMMMMKSSVLMHDHIRVCYMV